MAIDDLNGLKIKSRLLSGYCDNCIKDKYEDCLNQGCKLPWEDVRLESEGFSARKVTRGETGEQQSAIKDLITKSSIVAIASGDPGEDYYLLQVTGQRAEIIKTLAKDNWDAFFP